MNKRNQAIDILKGIGIILVVSFHANGPFGHFLNLFFMAIFFLASGYCYNDEHHKDYASIKRYFLKLIKRLYIPYVVYNLFLLSFHNIFVSLYLLDDRKYVAIDFVKRVPLIFAFMVSELWAGATWFVRALFFVLISFALIGFLFRRMKSKTKEYISILIIMILLICLWLTNDKYNVQIVNNIKFILGGWILLYIGHKLPFIKYLSGFHWTEGLLAFIILLLLNQFRTITWGLYYGNPIFFLLASLSGWYFIGGIASIISKSELLTCIFGYIGRNSMVILFLHFMSFKVASVAQIKRMNLEISLLSSFPTIDLGSIEWRIVNIVCGVAIPLTLQWVYREIVNHGKRGIKNEN